MKSSIGKKIKKEREKVKMTQSELAATADVSRALICQLEKGLRNDVKVTTLTKIAKALNCELNDLIN